VDAFDLDRRREIDLGNDYDPRTREKDSNSFGCESENTYIIFGCVLGKLWISASLDIMSVEHEKSGSIHGLRFRRVVVVAVAFVRMDCTKS
jgi:hypothetical protein